jgi:ribose transport system substrate-binding protein
MKAAISALEGNPMPQLISVPIPAVDYTTLKDNVNFWSNLSDNFFAANEFPACGVNVTAPEIMGKDAKNTQ